ncbi:MAG: hypothetical protein IKA36_04020 [Clostridia bacterium]|nr:hypothetical protein [Clostridia bacterium]
MITIDKNDELYKYLSKLKVKDIDDTYKLLASQGRYKRQDVLQYFRAEFDPSLTQDIDDKDLEKIVDYYADIRQSTKLTAKQVNQLLKEYSLGKKTEYKNLIVQYYLKDVMMLCLNYKSLHKDIDLQDLIQIANLGLLEALENYDADAKVKFDDYIIYCVYKNVTEEYKEKK